MTMKLTQFRLTAYTDPAGKWDDAAPKRGNEDDLFVDANLTNDVQGEFFTDRVETLGDLGALMVVADGMGGTNAGEVASAIAIQTVKSFFQRERLSADVVRSAETRARYMERLVVAADNAIKSEAKRNPDCEGMGSTIVLVWLYGGEATATWCGDSRAYLYRAEQGLRQITKDHSYVQELVDKGLITEEIAFDHPMNNIITRSLGDPGKQAQPESRTVPVYKGDILMVCSDGLCGVLRDRKSYDMQGNQYPGFNMEDLIRENRASMQGLREVLWAAAESSDWYDNVTVILCELLEGESPMMAPQPQPEPRNPNPRNPEPEPMKTKSYISFRMSKRTALWTALLILFALLAVGGYLLFGRKSVQAPALERKTLLLECATNWGISELVEELGKPTEEINLENMEVLLMQAGKKYLGEQLDSLSRANETSKLYGELLEQLAQVATLEELVAIEQQMQIQAVVDTEEPEEEPTKPERRREQGRPTAPPAESGVRGSTPAQPAPSQEQDSPFATEELTPGQSGQISGKGSKGETGSNSGAREQSPEVSEKPAPVEGNLTPLNPSSGDEDKKGGDAENSTSTSDAAPSEEATATTDSATTAETSPSLPEGETTPPTEEGKK